ncbi:MAG: type II toxin-antitoxin system RelE/ParE family toxin [Planctomycetes bacterium]|nr:type II toxin-antitoxin system RelE/ParE family toxin [Planctomycetota bacterium]
MSAAFDALLVAPLSGRVVSVKGVRGVRRLGLRRTRHHIYYRVEKDTVTVVALWSAVRGRGPTPAELRGRTPRRRKR